MIERIADLAVSPQPYADYRPIFETKRLNVTHVSIHPGETVPALHAFAVTRPSLR